MSGARTQDFFACLGSHTQHHGVIGLRARLIDQGIGTVQQATYLPGELRAAPRQTRPGRDKARVALGQAIRLSPRHGNNGNRYRLVRIGRVPAGLSRSACHATVGNYHAYLRPRYDCSDDAWL